MRFATCFAALKTAQRAPGIIVFQPPLDFAFCFDVNASISSKRFRKTY
jgi:hypothetical protein